MAKAKNPPPEEKVKRKRGCVPPPMHTRWKPGQSGNPSGYAGLTPEMKRFKNLTKKELQDIGNLVIKGDVAEIRRLHKDQNSTVLQVMLAAVCLKAIEKGDMHSIDIFLNRMIGKVRDEVHSTGNGAQVVVNLPSNGREVKAS